MRDYVIITDSSCDLTGEWEKELGIEAAPLTAIVGGKSYKNYLDEREITCNDFYQMMRDGKDVSTSAVNVDEFTRIMEAYLKEGKDILYLGFSSGLSATYQAGKIAAEELLEKYPEAKIYTLDTLTASGGQGLLVYMACQEKKAGKSIEEVRDYAVSLAPNIHHWIAVNDLHYLKKGGRISATAAILGTALQMKPILTVTAEGTLAAPAKVKGRKNAIKKLCELVSEHAVDIQNNVLVVTHGDCLEEAETLKKMILEATGAKDVFITSNGPVVGCHTGPGILAAFFVGTKR